MKRKLLLLIGAICLFSLGTHAQFTATGTVTDDQGEALIGATVLVKGTGEGGATDVDGKFSIQVLTNTGTLIFSYTGHQTKEVEVTAATSDVNVTLSNSQLLLSEIIVTAYGQSTKTDFTGSADVVTSEDLALRNVTSPIAAIEGKATGVQFTSASGQPGSSPDIVIRGVGTLNGSTQFEGNLNTINQNDIESFTVLKDAASTSLYGSRAANGVIIITTKSGTKGDIRVSASTQFGMVNRGIPSYEEVTPGQYYETMWEALKNSSAGGGDPAFASANIYDNLGYNPFDVPNENIVGTDGKLNPSANLIYKSLDWYDVMEQTGFRQNHNLSVAGGGDRHNIYFSASYLDEEGYVLKTNYDRLT